VKNREITLLLRQTGDAAALLLLLVHRLHVPRVGRDELRGRDAELEEAADDGGEVLEEEVLVRGVRLGVLLERLVLRQDVVRPVPVLVPGMRSVHARGHSREHHERARLLVRVLRGAAPLLPDPGLVEQELVVVVRERRGRERPRAVEAGAVRVAAPERVRARERDDLLVVEAHAPEDLAQVVAAERRVGQAPVRRRVLGEAVDPPRPPRDHGPAHLLHGGDAREGPQVAVRDPRELLLDLLHQRAGDVQAGVRAVEGLGGTSDTMGV
jgi:hypothetical protein